MDEAFASTLPPDEFIVIVNPYQPEVANELIQYVFSEPRITRYSLMSQNVGVATAWNLGMAMSTSDYIVILNDDCRVGQDTYEKMINEFSDPEVGIVGVLAGGFPEDPRMTAQGFLLAFSKKLFLDIGGYHEQSSPLADEVEYGLRAWASGYKTVIAPDCSWHHIHDISNNPNTVINYLGKPWIPTQGVPEYKDRVKGLYQKYKIALDK